MLLKRGKRGYLALKYTRELNYFINMSVFNNYPRPIDLRNISQAVGQKLISEIIVQLKKSLKCNHAILHLKLCK